MTGGNRAGRPLDASTATARARQAALLADPDRIRVLSALASPGPGVHTAASIAETTGLSLELVGDALREMLTGGLITSSPGATQPSYQPAAETWVLFGRFLAHRAHPPAPLPTAVLTDLPPAIESIAGQLAYRYSASFSKETVEQYVADSYRLLRERSRVTRHLASLTTRFATDRLEALASSQGFTLSGTPEVLFVCVQNAGRSQIAAAYLKYLAGDRVHVRTAGSQPAAVIGDQILDVLDEVGIPLVAEYPKPLTDEVVRAADVVVTMGCGDACPVYPGRRYLDWPVEDPVGRDLAGVRAIRDDIGARVKELAASLGLSPS